MVYKIKGDNMDFERLKNKVFETLNFSCDCKFIYESHNGFKVSLKNNIGLSDDIFSISYNKAKNFPYDTRTSFQRDYESKKGKDERDIFGKSLIEMAERYKIDCKVVDEIYRKL